MTTVPCIVMTAAQADAVRTDTLQPVKLTDGRYILGLNSAPNVLNDATHEAQWPLLKSYPQADVDASLWPVTDSSKL